MWKAPYLLILLSALGCASVNEQWFFVSRASIQQLDRHHELMRAFSAKDPPRLGYDNKEFVVTGHRIEEGNGTVIAYRRFDPGNTLLMDQSTFRKVTALIPQSQFKPGVEITIPGPNGAMVYYSESSSNFPGAGGCFGYASQGSIKIDSVSDTEATVDLDLRFSVASPLGSRNACAERAIRGVFTVPKVSVGKLSAWQGTPGKGIYDETMKRSQSER